ncbi:helix-hairpin-helix domain-containing protein [Halogeometricum pallidum]|uniref:helix-hairpin-helix domain-containing protein n=1 Tax=Halogeometricum pallidum TaxID=411361 RepID=UPI001267CDEE|nr:helix-hairpin-helix domain-containing protein [Halogeometricum pallidum]
MTLRANRHVLAATRVDSGALTQVGVVLHRFDEPGTYQCRVFRGERLAGRCFVVVDPDAGASDATVDLAEVGHDGSTPSTGAIEADDPTYRVHPNGVVIFHVSRGPGSYHVVASRPRDGGEGFETVFDSTSLGTDDVFLARPVRPGRYTVTNAHSNAEGELVVTRPEEGDLFTPRVPVSATIGGAVDPERVETVAAQGVAYRVERRARVVVEHEADLESDREDENREPVRPRPRPRPGRSIVGRRPSDDRFTLVHPEIGERSDAIPVDVIESIGEANAGGLASVGVRSVADLARMNPASVARAIDASPERASRLVETARLVTLGASSTTADLLTRLGETGRTIAGADPENLLKRIRTGIAEGELPESDGFDPAISELGPLVANANRFGVHD